MRKNNILFITLSLIAGFSISLQLNNTVFAQNAAELTTGNAKPLVYIEPGPVQKAIDPADGSEIEIPTNILWTIFYENYPENYSQDDFEQFIKSRRILQNLNDYRIIDNSGSANSSKGLNIIKILNRCLRRNPC